MLLSYATVRIIIQGCHCLPGYYHFFHRDFHSRLPFSVITMAFEAAPIEQIIHYLAYNNYGDQVRCHWGIVKKCVERKDSGNQAFFRFYQWLISLVNMSFSSRRSL